MGTRKRRNSRFFPMLLSLALVLSAFAEAGPSLRAYAAEPNAAAEEAAFEEDANEAAGLQEETSKNGDPSEKAAGSKDEADAQGNPSEKTAIPAASAEMDEASGASEVTALETDEQEEPSETNALEAETPQNADENQAGASLTWSLTDGVLTLSGSGDMYDFGSPTSSSSTKKAPWVEERKNITKIVLPEGLTSIGSYAFYETTALTQELTIPENVTKIGTYAFYKSGITGNLTIPATVASLGENAFGDCQGLAGDLVMRSGSLTVIPKYAFYNCPFQSVTLPSTLQEVKAYAFDNLSRDPEKIPIVIPALVNTIDDYAFDYSKAVFYFKGNVPARSLYDPYNEYWQVNHPLGYNNADGKIYYIEGNSGWIPNSGDGRIGNYTMTSLDAKDSHFSTANDDETLPAINDSGSCGANLSWAISGTMADLTLTITGSGKMSDYTEKSPAPWGEYMPAIRHLSLPEELTYIGSYAFYRSYALSGALSIPEKVTGIGNYAFYMSGFYNDKLTIPASVENIGEYAFYRCRGIRSLELKEGLASIGKYAFEFCNGLGGSLTTPSTLKTLSEHTFSECRNFSGSLVMRSGLEEISSYAFYRTGFQEVTLPSTLLILRQAAFHNCDNVQKYVVPALVYNIGAHALAPTNSSAALTDIYFKGNAPFEMDGSAADDWKNYLGDTSKVTLHYIKGRSGWTNLWSGYAAQSHAGTEAGFSDENASEALEAVEDGGKCGSKLEWAVSGTPDDLTLTLTGSGNMNSFTKDSVPWSSYRHKIRHLVLPDGLTGISDYAFYEFTAVNGDLIIPAGVKTIGQYAFANCGFGNETLTIPANVESIGASAFRNCKRFQYLVIENGLQTIGEFAFNTCAGFQGDLEIPASVESIGKYAFAGCSAFSGELVVNANIATLEDGAFQRCAFTEVTLPQTLAAIKSYAFSYCDKTTKVTIPPLVDFVAASAFTFDSTNSASPRSVYFEGNAPTNALEATYANSALSQAF
ncbi:MAG: leucine-rich repeat domain-containing protein, partial [Lachnospiraceae bacterium]|nr:leucine-rich repeat domain-containing protein [Lachnospiraceae bacterium]